MRYGRRRLRVNDDERRMRVLPVRPSVRPSVCPVQLENQKVQKTKIGVQCPHKMSALGRHIFSSYTHVVIWIESSNNRLDGFDRIEYSRFLAKLFCHRVRFVNHYHQVFRIRRCRNVPRPTKSKKSDAIN